MNLAEKGDDKMAEEIELKTTMEVGDISYGLDWHSYPDCAQDLRFLATLLPQILAEFQMLSKIHPNVEIGFSLTIGELHLDQEVYAWQVEALSPDWNEMGPCRVESSWQEYYFARCLNDRTKNYAGSAEVDLRLYHRGLMTTDEEKQQLDRMMRTAFMMYYENVASSYPDWESDYIDAPKALY